MNGPGEIGRGDIPNRSANEPRGETVHRERESEGQRVQFKIQPPVHRPRRPDALANLEDENQPEKRRNLVIVCLQQHNVLLTRLCERLEFNQLFRNFSKRRGVGAYPHLCRASEMAHSKAAEAGHNCNLNGDNVALLVQVRLIGLFIRNLFSQLTNE